MKSLDRWVVRGLRLPQVLIDAIEQGRWRHPGDERLRELMPWMTDPLDFLSTPEAMATQSASLDDLLREERWRTTFKQDSSRRLGREVPDLPWIDVDRAFLIAVNRRIGDDVALALDFRSSTVDPRVIAEPLIEGIGYEWRLVSPTTTAFLDAIGSDPSTFG